MSPGTDGNRPDPRRPRPGSSRAGTSRPRRLAGTGGPVPDQPAPDQPAPDQPAPDQPEADHLEPEQPELEQPAPEGPAPGEDASRRTLPAGLVALAGPRGRRVLVGVVAALALVVAAEGLYLWRSAEDPVTASADEPVAVPEQQWRPAVEAAAQGAEIILGAGWEEYDEGIERARAVMTDEFAETYLATKEDVREEFVADRTEVEVRVLGQAVTRATGSTVSALVFFDQYVTKEGSQTSFSQFRALVTVVDTPDGWLVDQIDTR